MQKTIFTIILCFITLSVSAQQSSVKEQFNYNGKTFLLDKINEQMYDPSMHEWVPGTRTTHIYDENNNLLQREAYHWKPVDEAYLGGNRSEYAYDQLGRVKSFIYYMNMESAPQKEPLWAFNQREDYTYIGESNLLERIEWTYPPEADGEEYVCAKLEYTYDDNGQLTKSEYSSRYSADGEWYLSQVNEYSEPNEAGLYTKRRQDIYFLGTVTSSAIERYVYNQQGLKTEINGYSISDDAETLKSKTVFTYTPEGLYASEDMRMDFGSGEPTTYMKLLYEFDKENKYTTKKEVHLYNANFPDGQKITECDYSWIDKTFQSIYAVASDSEADEITVCNGIISVNCNDNVFSIAVYNLNGQLMATTASPQGNAKRLEVTGLTDSGSYIVVANCKNNLLKRKVVL